MRWITSICLENYRAFAGPYKPIEINPGQHLLVYGENGSGKSSLYNALRDFFLSADTFKPFDVNFFNSGPPSKGSLEIVIAEIGKDFKRIHPLDTRYVYSEPNNSLPFPPELRMANKLKGFLDYRQLLQTHLVPSTNARNPNLFALFIEGLLSDHFISKPGGGVVQIPLGEWWSSIKRNIGLAKRSSAFKDAVAELPTFERTIEKLLREVFANSDALLAKYFKAKLKLDVEFRIAYDSAKGTLITELYLKPLYVGVPIPQYQLFLNEARLSAVAICIFLASIRTRPLSGPSTPYGASDNLKILFLDDVFIGLDTSNRFPLLEIINDEFVKSDYQVFISTYDREWYELSRMWFKDREISTKCVELFAEVADDPATPDRPVLIDQNLAPLERAEQYLKAKDYAASGNYIRKACEQAIIGQLLSAKTYLVNDDGTPIRELETLLLQFRKFYEDSNISVPEDVLNAIRLYRKAILNPSSHSDLKSPIYKVELESALKLAKTLVGLPHIYRKAICGAGTVFTYDNTAEQFHIEIQLTNEIFRIDYDTTKAISKYKFTINTWSWNGVEFATDAVGAVMSGQKLMDYCDVKRELAEIFNGIHKTTKIPIPPDLSLELKVGTRGTLSDLLK